MTFTRQILDSHPQDLSSVDLDALATCIDACVECAQACTACADACLGESSVADLVGCIRTDLDCADICATTANVLTRQTGDNADLSRTLLEVCAKACKTCGAECESHADMHNHCRICAEACRACEEACEALLASVR